MNNQDKENYENVTLGDLADGLIGITLFLFIKILYPGVRIATGIITLTTAIGLIIFLFLSVIFQWYEPYSLPKTVWIGFITGVGTILVLVFVGILYGLLSVVWDAISGIVVYRRKIQDEEEVE